MATDDCQISADPNAESSRLENKELNILPALRDTEGSSNNLRRGNLPFGIFSHNLVDTGDTAPRSSNADGTRSQDKPISLNLRMETKTAFEDLPVFPRKIGQIGENREANSSRRTNDTNLSITEHASEEVQNAVDSSSTRDKKIRFTEPLFQARTLASKTLYAASGEEPENSLCSNLTRLQAESATNSKHVESLGRLISEPSTTKGTSKREDERKEGNQRESNDDLSTKLQQTADGKTEEATDNANEVEEDDTTVEGRERFDTMASLLEFPFLPSLQTDSRRKSSPASLKPFSAPAHQTDASRQGNFSLGGVQKFPSTSGQSEGPSTPGSSNEAARRPSSPSRRTSIAASVAGSGETKKKGSIGLGILASSLVRWKINTARAKKRAQETIAKDAKHQEFMDRAADRIKTELPRSLLIDIQEEAYPIILRTAQVYRSQLGAKHKLTVQASERLADLMRDLNNPY
ncbi:uncharacterized protein LOC111330391 [Stylophora pistillata]|uniref:uncharacterized protein LOC111330391 n=1 Tax=Stylophora pistillata TaxID=50429 RepID=UPI000C041E32|nr:uncharacterized protein LOC111330391 [Stylophora pistillata]